jgi:hypothetical protein
VIGYRGDTRSWGYLDNAIAQVPATTVERLHTFMSAGDQDTLHVNAPAVDGPGPHEKLWLNTWLEPCDREHAVYSIRAEGREEERWSASIRTLDGRMKAKGSYADAWLRIPHGTFTFYYDNGQVECTGAFDNGQRTGVWQRYTEEGRPLTEKVYDPAPLNVIYGQLRPADGSPDVSLLADRNGTLATVVGTTPPGIHVVREPDPIVEVAVIEEPADPKPEPPKARRTVRPSRPALSDTWTGLREETRVEHLRVTTIIRTEEDGYPVEYRRVATYYGPIYYFRNGESCTAERYAKGTRREP